MSDDSHGVSYIGLNYIRMKDYLESMGVGEIWYLVSSGQKQSGDMTVGMRGRVVARRLAGDWRIHPFWAQMASAQAQTVNSHSDI